MLRLLQFSTRFNYRYLPVQLGIMATFACMPFWLRMPYAAFTYDPLYGMGFLITLPIIWTILTWLLAGMPGFAHIMNNVVRFVFTVAIIALAVWMWLSVRWSFMTGHDQPNVAQSAALQFSMIALWVVAVASAAPPPRFIASILVFNGIWNSAIAILQVANKGAIGLSFLGEFKIAVDASNANVLLSNGVRWLRPSGLLPHPNTLAGILLVGLLATTVFILSEKGLLRRIGIAAAVFILWGFLLTFSRAGILGFAAGAFALLPFIIPYLRIKAVRRAIFIAITALIFTSGLFFSSYRQLILTRAGVGTESVELRSIADRLIFSLFAYRAVTESNQNLFFGVGAGNFPWRSSYYLVETDYDLRGNNVHHVFLSAWVETGLVGYTLFVIALFMGFQAGLQSVTPRTQKHREANALAKDDQIARAAFLAGVVALGIVGLFDHYPWTMIQFQALWWGLLATASVQVIASKPPSEIKE